MTSLAALLKKNLSFILILAVLTGLITGVVTSRLPRTMDVSISFTIPIPERPLSNNYEYDGYYALQATDLFASTFAGWLHSPEFVSAVYEKAGILKKPSIRALGKAFTTRKVSGQLVELQFSASSSKEAENISNQVVIAAKEKVSKFNSEGQKNLTFSVISADPLVIPASRNASINALVAFVIVLVLGINVLIFVDAYKRT